MKMFKDSITDCKKILQTLTCIKEQQKEWTLWKNKDNHRAISIANISQINSHMIIFSSKNNGFNLLNNDDLIYFYDNKNIIFKAIIKNVSIGSLQTKIPHQIYFTSDQNNSVGDYITDCGTSIIKDDLTKVKGQYDIPESDTTLIKGEREDLSSFCENIPLSREGKIDSPININKDSMDEYENSKQFKHLRETERMRPRESQRIKIQRVINGQASRPESFLLADLSQGGAGFYTKDKCDFKKGETLLVVESGGNTISPPLAGEVMAIRLENPGDLQFKVGIKFNK